MSDWEVDCLKFHGRVLTGPKRHWCPDWDGLPVDETTDEMQYGCACTFDDKKAD